MLSVVRGASDGRAVGAAAVALIGVVCCAGLPVMAAFIGGLTLAAVLGVASGILALVGLLARALVVVRGRRRRHCPPATRSTPR